MADKAKTAISTSRVYVKYLGHRFERFKRPERGLVCLVIGLRMRRATKKSFTEGKTWKGLVLLELGT